MGGRDLRTTDFSGVRRERNCEGPGDIRVDVDLSLSNWDDGSLSGLCLPLFLSLILTSSWASVFILLDRVLWLSQTMSVRTLSDYNFTYTISLRVMKTLTCTWTFYLSVSHYLLKYSLEYLLSTVWKEE